MGARRLSVVLPALTLVLGATLLGCAAEDEPPSAGTTGQQASPTAEASPEATTSPGAGPSADPSASPTAAPTLEDSPCRVEGFRPGKRVVLRSQRRTLLYAAGLDLGPGVSTSGADRLQLTTDVHPGGHVVSPSGASVDRALLSAVGTTVKRSSPAPLPGEFFIRRKVSNPAGAQGPRAYAQYVAARVYRGSWSARVCGGVTNDGTSVTVVRGSFTTIGLTDSGVIPCERVTGERPEWVRRLAVVCD